MEVEDEVELAHVLEVVVEDLHEEMDRLEVSKLVIVHINTHGEEEACITPIYDFVRAELHLPSTDNNVDSQY